MNDEYNRSRSENDYYKVGFREFGIKMKFKDIELEFGRQTYYRYGDDS